MIDWSEYPARILPLLKNHNVMKSMRRQPKIYTDTSDFTRIDYGDILYIGDKYFLIVGYAKEGRFGIEEQAKQWVPKVYDLETGERKIIKLVFHENFTIKFGTVDVTCYRRPEKEAEVMDLVFGHPMFMQGYSVLDDADNVVRILDIVQGTRLDTVIGRIKCDQETYLTTHVEQILRSFLKSVEALTLLHQNGLKHGDVRRDHIYVDRENGLYRWIDFDYDFHLPECPFALDLIGLGNILLFILGRQNFRPVDVLQNPQMGQKVLDTLHTGDLSLLSQDRIFNLKKLFPSIPKCFNDILLHFSASTNVMYETSTEFQRDLEACIKQVYG